MRPPAPPTHVPAPPLPHSPLICAPPRPQLLEFPPVGAGNVEASLVSVNTVRLFQYVTKGDMAVLGLEVVVMVFVLYYTVVELIEMRNKGFK